jgi:hypothetical protein
MLNWNKIDGWEKFERLSLYLVDEELKLNTFNLYLKKGYEQEGIDIKGFDFNTGRYSCVQCKHVETLTLPELKKLIEKFKSGGFYNKTSRFILTTTADLTDKKIEDYIAEQEDAFKKADISFQCWDKVKITEKLKKYTRIVEHFFSLGDAVAWCMRPNTQEPRIQQVPNFIERKISPFKNRESFDIADIMRNYYEETRLHNLLIPLDRQTPRICLLGEPQDGKTSLIRQTAYELQNLPVPTVPILVELKNTPAQPISAVLNTFHPYWMNQPSCEMVVILDGLDEVAGEDFIETLKYINGFAIEYPTIPVIVSCRNLFYYRYRIKEILKDFQFFELSPLSYQFIDTYVDGKLKAQAEQFKTTITQNDLWSLLYKPFFLTYLANLYLLPGKSIPDSRIAILDHCIDHSLEPAKARQIRKGKLFEHKIMVYKKAMRKLSFALQLASKNSFHEEEMQVLFSDDELDLLQHSTLISRTQIHWSFNTALFQEHLSGSVLSSFSFEEIRRLTTVGEAVKKIKTKWVQTLASSLSVLDINDQKRKDLVSLIEADNVELLTLAEPNQFSNEEKLAVLQKIIRRYKLNNTRPVFNDIRENNIGGFCRGADQATEFLIKTIAGKSNERIKNTCWRILQYCTPKRKYDKTLYDLAAKELFKTKDGYYANNILETLAGLSIGNAAMIEKLIAHPSLQSNHDYRNGVYQLIISLNLVDSYYDYGLQGYATLFEHNKEISHSMSEKTLETFLLSTRQEKYIGRLLIRIANEDWLNFYHYKSTFADSFIDKFTRKLIETYSINPLVIFPIVKFFRFTARKHSTKDFAKLKTFFAATGTKQVALEIFFLDPEDNRQWEFYELVDEECFDYILFLHEENIISGATLRTIFGSLRHHSTSQLAELFFARAQSALEGNLYNKEQDKEALAYQQMYERRIENDKKYIRSVDEFRNGIRQFFTDYGKKAASADDLYIDNDSRAKRQETASNFIYNFLVDRLRRNNIVYLTDCLTFLESEDAFEDFSATQLLHYNHSREEIREFISLLSSYYSKYIGTTDFTNAVYELHGRFYIKHRPSILADIFQRFKFETPQHILPELLWLDRNTNRDRQKDTLSAVVIERLDSDHMAALPQKISSRIRNRIINHEVLENHLQICHTHKFTLIVPDILQLISKKQLRQYYYADATKIYLSLGGSVEELVPIFKSISDFTEPYFWFLGDQLRNSHEKLVKEQLLNCLRDHENANIKLDAAKRLTDMGEKSGFSFIMEKLRTERVSPITIQGGYKLYNVETDFALSEMKDMCHLILDRAEDSHRQFYTVPGNVMLEVLYGLAMKSEADLLKVDKFLRQNFKKLKPTHSNAIDLLWYAERHLEEYRKSDSTKHTIEQIHTIISLL